jgi:hypothetical protein
LKNKFPKIYSIGPFELVNNNSAHEQTRNHKKEIHAKITIGKKPIEMVKYYRKNCNRPEYINTCYTFIRLKYLTRFKHINIQEI